MNAYLSSDRGLGTSGTKMAPPLCPLLVESRARIDALGYVDAEYNDPQVQQAVQQLIRAEMGTFAPAATYLDYLPDYSPTFGGHSRLQTEFKRVAAGVPLDAIDFSRYQVKAPSGKAAKSAEAWEQAVQRLKISVEHESNRYELSFASGSSCRLTDGSMVARRVTNLELQQTYGTKIAKARAVLLDGVNAQCARALSETRSAAEKVNLARKQEQDLNAPQLQSHQRKFDALVAKNASIKVCLLSCLLYRLILTDCCCTESLRSAGSSPPKEAQGGGGCRPSPVEWMDYRTRIFF